jgi:hypothetical protein
MLNVMKINVLVKWVKIFKVDVSVYIELKQCEYHCDKYFDMRMNEDNVDVSFRSLIIAYSNYFSSWWFSDSVKYIN